MRRHTTKNPQETIELASDLLKKLNHKGIICLYAKLGGGKTTFTKGLALSLEISKMSIKSPTYTYIREYRTSTQIIFHADLYRLEGKAHAANALLEEMLEQKPDLIIIEWAEHLGKNLPKKRTDVKITTLNDRERQITIEHHGLANDQ